MGDRDLALVLSGGGMNGLLLELGFLKRVRETPLWPRVGWIYGTSAGALAGVMAAVDRLDDMEAFVLGLRPEETFRPNRLWQTPLNGLRDYALPETLAERLAPIDELAREVASSPVELLVTVTDVTDGGLPTSSTHTSTSTRAARRPSTSWPAQCSPRRRSAPSCFPSASAT